MTIYTCKVVKLLQRLEIEQDTGGNILLTAWLSPIRTDQGAGIAKQADR
jgi:hypothetical protein